MLFKEQFKKHMKKIFSILCRIQFFFEKVFHNNTHPIQESFCNKNSKENISNSHRHLFVSSFARGEDGSRDESNYGIRHCYSAPKSKSDKGPNKCRGPIALTVETSCREGHRMIQETIVSRRTPLRNASSSDPNDSRSWTHQESWWYLNRTNVARICSRERCPCYCKVVPFSQEPAAHSPTTNCKYS